jgi:hypothetical protein
MGTRQIGLLDIVHGGRHSRVRLLAPLRYLLIRHPEKYRYDVLVPVLTGVAFWVGYLLIEPKPKLFGDAGLLRFARDLLLSGAVHGGRSGRRLNGRAGRPHGPAAGGLGAVLGRRAAHAQRRNRLRKEAVRSVDACRRKDLRLRAIKQRFDLRLGAPDGRGRGDDLGTNAPLSDLPAR